MELLHQHVAKRVGRQGLQSLLVLSGSPLYFSYGHIVLPCGVHFVVQT